MADEPFVFEDSILKLTKQTVGVPEDYPTYDNEIIMDINSVFSILFQLGVGTEQFRITGATETWTSFFNTTGTGSLNIDDVKTYMRNKVKLMFDPPSSSFLVQLLQDQCKEFECRINYQVDTEVPSNADSRRT